MKASPPRRPRKPRALQLALSRRSRLIEQAKEVSQQFLVAGQGNVFREFRAFLGKGTASINMSMLKLIRFLDTGRWLNIYEAVAKERKLRGRELEREVIDRLKDFGEPRLAIDRLFRFPRDTHYAALNLGGPGPYAKYGICCVVFDLRRWRSYYTCFAGDSLQAGFDHEWNPAYGGEPLLERFAAGEDLGNLAVVKRSASLKDHSHRLDRGRVRRLLEGAETLIELHLFGKVTRIDISEVRLPQASYERLHELARELARNPTSTARELDAARAFCQLVHRLDRHKIRLRVCGDS